MEYIKVTNENIGKEYVESVWGIAFMLSHVCVN